MLRQGQESWLCHICQKNAFECLSLVAPSVLQPSKGKADVNMTKLNVLVIVKLHAMRYVYVAHIYAHVYKRGVYD